MELYTNGSIYQAVQKLNESAYLVCFDAPPAIVSDGIWIGKLNGRAPMKSSLPLYELQVLVIFAVTRIFQFFFKFLDFPVFIAQMAAGIVLGPTIHNDTLDKYKKLLFPYGSQDTLASVSSLGYILFIFVSAVQMDISMITRLGHKAWTLAAVGLIVPMLICVPIALQISPNIRASMGDQQFDLPVVVVSHTVISFAVIASLLNELKITNSQLGRLALSAVLVSDVTTTSLSSIFTAILLLDSRWKAVHVTSVLSMVILVPLVCRPIMFSIIKHTPEGRAVKDSYIYTIIIIVFVLGVAASVIRQEFMLGAFVLGLAVPEGPPLGSALVKKLHFFGNCFFLPIFVTCIVMKVDLSLLDTSSPSLMVCLFAFFTHLVKIVACFVTAIIWNMPVRDALALALILNCKGIVELCLYSSFYDASAITSKTYAQMLISIMVISCVVKWSVKFLYDPSRKYASYEERNIMNIKPESELRILACIHKRYHIPAIIDCLELCCPTPEHPIVIHALHLIELIGRTSPIFMTHRHQKMVSSTEKAYSDDIILAFDIYEHTNQGAVTAHTYTALSPPTLMHDDVCQVALDKLASLVILPFHKRWSSDGTVESDDKNIKSMNCKVLEIAPCSVGILVSRSSFQSDSHIRLAIVFVGGQDDREALCLAKRSMMDPRVNLVVYHLVLDEYIPSPDDLLDDAVLQEFMKPTSSGSGNVSYQRLKANDGSDTSAILCNIVNDHDFFIVGRRHAEDTPQIVGLGDWSEFPELGVIGDVLASPDFESQPSILVVQQQTSKKKREKLVSKR